MSEDEVTCTGVLWAAGNSIPCTYEAEYGELCRIHSPVEHQKSRLIKIAGCSAGCASPIGEPRESYSTNSPPCAPSLRRRM